MKIKLFITLLIIAGSANAVNITFNNNTGKELKNITNNQTISVNQRNIGFDINDNPTRLLELKSDSSKYITASTTEITVSNNNSVSDSQDVTVRKDSAGVWDLYFWDGNLMISPETTTFGGSNILGGGFAAAR